MIRTIMALAIVAALAPMQDDDKPRKRGQEELRRREHELAARLDELKAAVEKAEGDELEELKGKMARTAEELEEVRATLRKGHGDQEAEAELAKIEERLRDENLSKEERRKLEARAKELRGKRHAAPPRFCPLCQIRTADRRCPKCGRDLPPAERDTPEPPVPPPPDRDRPRDFDKRLVDEVLAFAKEFEPEAHRRAAAHLERGEREAAWRIVMDLRPRLQELNELRERNPEEFRRRQEIAAMERDCWLLADKLRKTVPEDRAAGKERLLATLGKLFDMREETRRRELEELERRVAELRKTLERRRENKSAIVEKRAQDMMGDEFDW